MRILRADKSNIPSVIQKLEAGEVIIIPTETVYGLAADGACEEALEKIRRLKGGDPGKPLQRLVSDVEEVRRRVRRWDARMDRLAARFWPGPLTLVLEDVGWRVPDHDFMREVLRRFGRPLAATSANPAGEPPAVHCHDAVRMFEGKIDLALDGGRGSVGKASSVIRAAGPVLEILREEAISREKLLECWEGGAEAS